MSIKRLFAASIAAAVASMIVAACGTTTAPAVPAASGAAIHGGKLENGFKIFHMGDTGLFGDLKFIGDYYKPDLILIPIGGHYVMDPKEAALMTRDLLKPRYAIPVHYGTNAQLKGTAEEYISAMGNSPVKVFSLKPGEQLEF
jgi:L-ascorbate metabolism protein UlaG (beta-lactamase superfamily)